MRHQQEIDIGKMGRLDPQFRSQVAAVHGRGAGRARQGEGEAEAGALGLAAGDAGAGVAGIIRRRMALYDAP